MTQKLYGLYQLVQREGGNVKRLVILSVVAACLMFPLSAFAQKIGGRPDVLTEECLTGGFQP